jgi:hypothetical protein
MQTKKLSGIALILLGLMAYSLFFATREVQAESREEVEKKLQEIWMKMTSALLAGNAEHALSFFIASKKEEYRKKFEEMGSQKIQSVFSNAAELKLYSLYEDHAQCGAIRMEKGGRYSYPVRFRKISGQWKIYSF